MKKLYKFLQDRFNRAVHFFQKSVWQIPADQIKPFQAFLIRQLRIIILAIQGALKNKIYMLAPALTYFSLLSIVPAAALALGIARGFGLERFLVQQLQISLAGREDVLEWVAKLIEVFFIQIDSGVVAVTGLGVLIYTVIMMLAAVEKIFNQIWQVRYGRTWLRRLRDYFAIAFLGSLLLITAGAATVFLSSRIELLEDSLLNPLLILMLRLAPYLLIWSLFTLLYMVMPNTRVNFYPAMVAGIIAGTAFQLIQWAYITFQIGAASLGLIYGSFAALPLLMIWMQISWIVVLLGAELSYASQNLKRYIEQFSRQ
jgi:membrane protein